MRGIDIIRGIEIKERPSSSLRGKGHSEIIVESAQMLKSKKRGKIPESQESESLITACVSDPRDSRFGGEFWRLTQPVSSGLT